MPVQAVLVDDDSLALLMLDGLLSQLGVGDTLPVGSGQEALQLFRRDATERVCFVDVHMPGMDGLELIRHLSEEASCVGVVLMSGEDQRILRSAEELATAQGLRVIAALSKPIALA
ncbi:MAG: diguanylate cyclase, partial [Polyangiaceae bacterium]|nr:diguanylate cyclase [Polyangiaceae bacterium]